MGKGITAAGSKLLERYHSQASGEDNCREYQNITQAYIPKIVLKRNAKSSSTGEVNRKPSHNLIR